MARKLRLTEYLSKKKKIHNVKRLKKTTHVLTVDQKRTLNPQSQFNDAFSSFLASYSPDSSEVKVEKQNKCSAVTRKKIKRKNRRLSVGQSKSKLKKYRDQLFKRDPDQLKKCHVIKKEVSMRQCKLEVRVNGEGNKEVHITAAVKVKEKKYEESKVDLNVNLPVEESVTEITPADKQSIDLDHIYAQPADRPILAEAGKIPDADDSDDDTSICTSDFCPTVGGDDHVTHQIPDEPEDTDCNPSYLNQHGLQYDVNLSYEENCIRDLLNPIFVSELVDSLSKDDCLSDFMCLYHNIRTGKMPTTNMAFLTCIETARGFSLKNTVNMWFRKKTKQYYQVILRLFGGEAIRLMSGGKHHGQVVGQESSSGYYDPADGHINWFVPDISNLTENHFDLPDEMLAGIIESALKLLDKDKEYVLAVDGKKIAQVTIQNRMCINKYANVC